MSENGAHVSRRTVLALAAASAAGTLLPGCVGQDIQATDESIGHVKDFIFDEASWVIRYLVVDTRNWWPGGKIVLVATPWIESIDWDASIVRVKLARKQVMNSPEYVDATMIDRDYEQRLHDAHERDGYWLSQSRDTSLERRLTDGAN